MPSLIRAIQWDGVEDDAHPLPPGAHGEIDKDWDPSRRFVCVQANGACIEISPGWWIAYAPDGCSYPIPAEFVDPEPMYTKAEVEAAYEEGYGRAEWAEDPVNYGSLDLPLTCDEFLARLDAARTGTQEGE